MRPQSHLNAPTRLQQSANKATPMRPSSHASAGGSDAGPDSTPLSRAEGAAACESQLATQRHGATPGAQTSGCSISRLSTRPNKPDESLPRTFLQPEGCAPMPRRCQPDADARGALPELHHLQLLLMRLASQRVRECYETTSAIP